jgi:hypothetical protein
VEIHILYETCLYVKSCKHCDRNDESVEIRDLPVNCKTVTLYLIGAVIAQSV